MILKINNIEYLIPVITGTLLFGLLTVFIIYFILLYRRTRVKLNWERERLKNELFRVENEVKEQTLLNVSRELHDNYGQIASLVKINLNMMSKDLGDEDLERVNETLILIKQLIGDIKTLSASLSGENLRKNGWITTIDEDVRRINSIGGLKVHFNSTGDHKLQHEKEVILYRVIQELLNNALKHAKASEANLTIRSEQNEVFIKFSDNGIGFNFNTVVKGAGLSNIEERCKMIGAKMEMSSNKQTGTEFQIHLKEPHGTSH